MLYGWAGTNLEVDLSQGKVRKEPLDRKTAETFLGGKGINAKILWDRVPPDTDAFSPDNLLIVGTGLFTGTLVPSASRTIITFKSPVMGMEYYCAMGGHFGPALKHAGYDTVIISGKSAGPVYLWINDDQVELRDARHLWGKDVNETQKIIRAELQNDDIEILSIGPAGENKVCAASIEGNIGSSSSRGGAGAVMGDKGLKAIAVHGTRDISLADGPRLMELCEQIMDRSEAVREAFAKHYAATITADLASTSMGAMRHFTGNVPDEVRQKVKDLPKTIAAHKDKNRTREVACFNCGIRCRWVYPSPGEDNYLSVKCQHSSAGMVNSQIIDCDFGLKFNAVCQKYGLDLISASNYIAFAIDLYKRGILTKQDTDGMELDWGNADVVFSLLEKIARREGIGEVLADGVVKAAQRIGKGAENYTYHTKKLEPLPFDARGWPSRALPIATIDKADRSRGLSGIFNRWERPLEEKEAYIKDGFFQYPREFEKYFLAPPDPNGIDYEGLVQFNAYNDEILALTDALGFCFFYTNFWAFPPVNNRTLMADLVAAATGMNIDEAGMTKIARRIGTLLRAYNVREGISRKDDDLNDFFFQKAIRPPYRQFDRALFNKWLDRYYELKGWDANGIPTGETLAELGLIDVGQDLERREILVMPAVLYPEEEVATGRPGARAVAFEPKVLAFCCSWCSYSAADLAGVSRIQYSPNLVILRVMCSGRVDPKFVLEGYLKGADGVMILGCHLGDCHYINGNYQAINSVIELRKIMDYIGLNPGRLKLDWASAAEGARFAEMVTSFTEQIRKLGPMGSAEGKSAKEMEFELRAAKMAAEGERLRGVSGKQTEFTTKGNRYGEIFTRHEMDRVLESIVAEEVPMSKILLLTQGKPMPVKEIAARIGISPPKVLKYVTALRRKGVLGLDSVDGTSPLYLAQSEIKVKVS